MLLFNLGKAPWRESQLIYHALAHMGHEALVLVSPASPYVCIGYHQDVDHEVDIEYCKANDIPIFRREVGGGAVYLDGGQLFFQVIIREDNPAAPSTKHGFYRTFLQPAIDVYRRIGISAVYKPINDIVVNTRKISGTGVGEIGDCIVFVGNLILDFDYQTMSRVLKVPDEKFRDKLQQTIEENLTTIRRELGDDRAAKWDEAKLNKEMAAAFQNLLGPFSPGKIDSKLALKVDELGRNMINDDWLHRKRRRPHQASDLRSVQIRSGVSVINRIHKATGGLMRADFELKEGRFLNISLSGDFFCFPADALFRLETLLSEKTADDVKTVLENFYEEKNLEIPGVDIDDWMQLLKI
ncbi:biotin/lipoate A/B protein ligase family protein [Thermodesulfobacteriota bacterium]